MTEDIFLYIVGILLLPFTWNQIRIHQMTRQLVKMHENPDAYGFGTIALSRVIDKNTKAFIRIADCLEDMDDVLRWLAKHDAGEGPGPPPRVRKP